MNPVSASFLLFFLAACIATFALPRRFRWMALLAFSAYFYYSAGLYSLPFLLFSALVAFFGAWGGRALDGKGRAGAAAWVFALSVAAELAVLFFLKYFAFFAELVTDALGLAAAPSFRVTAPLGISFYTFMAVGYLVDCRREVTEPERNFARFFLFLSFFPQVLQGPIGRYGELAESLYAGAEFAPERVTSGLWRMLWGFFKKLVIADRIGLFVDTVWAAPQTLPGWAAIAAAVGYAFQIYADFSGFMDIAIGGAEVLGVTLPENFDTPYLARSIPEFWRRWHITLNAWFRDYLFYPLQRTKWSKKLAKFLKKRSKFAAKAVPAILASCVVWLLTGLWHGDRLTYLAWGGYYAVLLALSMALEPAVQKLRTRLHWNAEHPMIRVLCILRTFVLVSFGYILFRSGTLAEVGTMLAAAAHPSGGWTTLAPLGLTRADVAVLAPALLLLAGVDFAKYRGRDPRRALLAKPFVLRLVLGLALVMAVLVFGLYGPSYDAASFIYFQF